MKKITKKLLREFFTYRKDGFFEWKKPMSTRLKPGDIAGCPDSSGYWRVRIAGKRPRLHRLVWIYHHGDAPKFLDHIDRNRLNSRIENLRPITRAQNVANRGIIKKTKSGYKGVTWNEIEKKWVARIGFEGKRYCLGYFKEKSLAAKAYNDAAVKYYGEFAGLNKIRK